jgi:hydrogenase nickel incorporation protein HypB
LHKLVDLSVEKSLLAANEELAHENLHRLEHRNIRAVDFMGSIGSGKTLLIEGLIDVLKEQGKTCGVISGDVSGNDDYLRFLRHTDKDKVVNVNTGKDCHLDAHRVEHALEDLALDGIDILFIENVGNLVCPADFPLGTHKRVVVISTTEGDDMVRKHPIIMAFADIIVINKSDLAEYVEVDVNVLVADAKRVNPDAAVILTDAKHGKGLDELLEAISKDQL